MMVYRVSSSGAIGERPFPLSCPQRANQSFHWAALAAGEFKR